jgi:hypothetical protein
MGKHAMKRICAWCKKPLDEEGGDNDTITHGICEACLPILLSRRISIGDFLSALPTPVLAVDEKGRIIAANTPALHALKKERLAVEDMLCGDVIECINAAKPGGCGNTAHCTGCQIRLSVEHTRATSESTRRVKAHQRVVTASGVKSTHYWISTEHFDAETVLVQIEPAEGPDERD